MGEKEELRDRVEAKKKHMEARVHELKADSRSAAREESRRLESKLEELEKSLEEGWEKVSEAVAGKLNEWLKGEKKT